MPHTKYVSVGRQQAIRYVFGEKSKVTRGFSTVPIGALNPCIVQESTILHPLIYAERSYLKLNK